MSDIPGLSPKEEINEYVSKNVAAIAELYAQEERQLNAHQRVAEKFAKLVGRPGSLAVIVVLVVFWTVGNLVAQRLGLPCLDPPPFFWLQGVVALSALLTTVVVVTTQNRQARLAERRAQLDLQVNLLVEQKTAKLIALVEELRRDLPIVQDRHDSRASAMQESADPRTVLRVLEETLDAVESNQEKSK